MHRVPRTGTVPAGRSTGTVVLYNARARARNPEAGNLKAKALRSTRPKNHSHNLLTHMYNTALNVLCMYKWSDVLTTPMHL